MFTLLLALVFLIFCLGIACVGLESVLHLLGALFRVLKLGHALAPRMVGRLFVLRKPLVCLQRLLREPLA